MHEVLEASGLSAGAASATVAEPLVLIRVEDRLVDWGAAVYKALEIWDYTAGTHRGAPHPHRNTSQKTPTQQTLPALCLPNQ